MTNQIKPGDKVRVKLYMSKDLGETLWTVEAVDGFRVTIKEDDGKGTDFASQYMDKSMLVKVQS